MESHPTEEQSDVVPDVDDWATDWDHNHPDWGNDPYPIWEELRGRCPMAHSQRYNEGIWLPLRFDDLTAIAHDPDTFSSNHGGITLGGTYRDRPALPPINSDPPEHAALRRTLLPFFAPRRIEAWRGHIEADCDARARGIAGRGGGDAAIDYAQHIPVGALAAILGIDPADGDQFRIWVDSFIQAGSRDHDIQMRAAAEVRDYMASAMRQRRQAPGDDLISHLVQVEIDGEPLDDDTIERMLLLQLIAGIETTWSSIGAALWHLATHADDRRRLVAEPELLPTAIEEFLRAYAPVSVGRRVTRDIVVGGVHMKAGDSVLMTYPIACRDPAAFDNADDVVIDRAENRHIAFGTGIHRCIGSNLARLEMQIALERFLHHIPEFELAPGAEVIWSAGQARGPRTVPIVVLPRPSIFL